MALDWDILNDDCADFTNWTNYDTAPGVTDQITFDGRSTWRFNMPASATGRNQIGAGTAIFACPTTFTLEWVIYADHQQDRYWDMMARVDMGSPRESYRVGWYTGVPGLYNGQIRMQYSNGPNFILSFLKPSDDLADGWHTIRMVVKAGRKVDLWVDDCPVFAGVVCSSTETINAGINLLGWCESARPGLIYVDTVRADSTPEAPVTTSPLQIRGEYIPIVPWHEAWGGSWRAPYPLRFYGKTLASLPAIGSEIALVATTSVNASKTRIFSGGVVKCLMKLPS